MTEPCFPLCILPVKFDTLTWLVHNDTVKAHEAHIVIIDGAAVVNMIKPRTPVSFDWYVTQAMEYVRKQFRGDVQRVDIWCLMNTGRIA